MAPANMSWTVARRLAALVVTTGLLLLPATHAAAISGQQRHGGTPRDRQLAGNDFDNSIPTYTDVKPIDSVDEASDFMIRCYCNMPACLAATGGVRTCTTRLGCFSQLQPNLPNLDGTVTHPVSTTTTQKMTTLIPEEFDVEAAIYGNDNALNGAYGCLDLLPINKTCDEVLKLMEREESEFPFIQTGTSSQSIDNVMSAYHCCEEDMCNDRSHIAASATNAEASLIAAFEKSMSQVRKVQKKTKTTTEEPAYMPIPVAFVSGRKEFFVNVGNTAPDVFPDTENSTNTTNIGISLSGKRDITSFIESTKNTILTNNKTTPEVFDTISSSLTSNTNITSTETISMIDNNVTFTEANSMVNKTTTAETATTKNVKSSSIDVDSEKNNNNISTEEHFIDNRKSLLSTEVSRNENATLSLIDIDVTPTITSEILSTPEPNVSEVIESDFNSVFPTIFIIKNTTEVIISKTDTEQEQENSGKLFREIFKRQNSLRALAFHMNPEEKTTSVVTPLETNLDSTKSPDNAELFTAQENDSNVQMDPSYNRHRIVDKAYHESAAIDVTPSSGVLDWTGISQWIEGVTGILAICGIIGITIMALAAIKIVRKTDVFEHYESVCSNPGQPCACNGGLGRRRSRQLTSSSTVYRNTTASIQPVLPPPNNSLYGLAYIDSTGNSTHVYTPIPVPL